MYGHPHFEKLAKLLVTYSVRVKKDEHVLIDVTDTPDDFTVELVRAVRKARGIPFINIKHSKISRELLREVSPLQATSQRDIEMFQMKKVTAYIAVRGAHNSYENSDVSAENLALYSKTLRPVIDQRVNKTKWVVLRWPTESMAQAASMSTESFEKFYFDVCTMDYPKMARAMIPLHKRMSRANKVHIKAPGTDLRFSIKGLGAIMCTGTFNIPDGEVFSCPVKESVQGYIQFNTPTTYSGSKFENIRLAFKDGKVVEATAGNMTKRLNEILDTDRGARYVGEFSLGFNPYIMNPMGDILFDEKIAGSLHFTPGQAYEVCDNGNRSAVHWDLVLIQRKEYGGGELWFDDVLIRKDGKFIPKDLRGLNWNELR